METLKRKGNNCEYIKIHFDNEAEYNAVIDCLTRAAMLIGESFSEDIDSHLELVQMIEKTKMVYENGTVSALIFNDFTEKLFLHCWDLSILTCKHANLYQPEQFEITENPVIEKENEQTPTEVTMDDIEDVVGEDVEEDIEEPVIREVPTDIEEFSFYESMMSEPIPAEPEIEEVVIEEAEEVLLPAQGMVEEPTSEVVDLLTEEESEETITEHPIVEDIVMEETTMAELEVDESALEELDLLEPDDEKLTEEALRKAALEAETARLAEEANARAAEIYASMIKGDVEQKQTNKFMQRFNKLFKK